MLMNLPATEPGVKVLESSIFKSLAPVTAVANALLEGRQRRTSLGS
jgi:hypothetical protein